MVVIPYDEIETAYEYVSHANPDEHSAVVDLDTGEIYYLSDIGDSDELPENFEHSTRSVWIPHRNDLDLGRRLIFAFVRDRAPHLVADVDDIFRSPGAYRRWSVLLEREGLQSAWNGFESRETERRLRDWCAVSGVPVSPPQNPATTDDQPDARAPQRRGNGADRRWHHADFTTIPGVPCPCGTARRAFHGIDAFPGTIHVTEIAATARRHYHRTLTETYYFLECDPGTTMELDGETIPVHPGSCIVIPPGVRHRAVGHAKVLIVVLPEFDPEDEWFD